MLRAWASGNLLGMQFSISLFAAQFSSSICSALVKSMKVGGKSKNPVNETEKRFPWTGRVHAMHGMFWGDGGGQRTMHFPGPSLHEGPLFRTRPLPMRPFAPPGHSVCACIGPHWSSPLELLTHNLLLAPAGVC